MVNSNDNLDMNGVSARTCSGFNSSSSIEYSVWAKYNSIPAFIRIKIFTWNHGCMSCMLCLNAISFVLPLFHCCFSLLRLFCSESLHDMEQSTWNHTCCFHTGSTVNVILLSPSKHSRQFPNGKKRTMVRYAFAGNELERMKNAQDNAVAGECINDHRAKSRARVLLL